MNPMRSRSFLKNQFLFECVLVSIVVGVGLAAPQVPPPKAGAPAPQAPGPGARPGPVAPPPQKQQPHPPSQNQQHHPPMISPGELQQQMPPRSPTGLDSGQPNPGPPQQPPPDGQKAPPADAKPQEPGASPELKFGDGKPAAEQKPPTDRIPTKGKPEDAGSGSGSGDQGSGSGKALGSGAEKGKGSGAPTEGSGDMGSGSGSDQGSGSGKQPKPTKLAAKSLLKPPTQLEPGASSVPGAAQPAQPSPSTLAAGAAAAGMGSGSGEGSEEGSGAKKPATPIQDPKAAPQANVSQAAQTSGGNVSALAGNKINPAEPSKSGLVPGAVKGHDPVKQDVKPSAGHTPDLKPTDTKAESKLVGEQKPTPKVDVKSDANLTNTTQQAISNQSKPGLESTQNITASTTTAQRVPPIPIMKQEASLNKSEAAMAGNTLPIESLAGRTRSHLRNTSNVEVSAGIPHISSTVLPVLNSTKHTASGGDVNVEEAHGLSEPLQPALPKKLKVEPRKGSSKFKSHPMGSYQQPHQLGSNHSLLQAQRLRPAATVTTSIPSTTSTTSTTTPTTTSSSSSTTTSTRATKKKAGRLTTVPELIEVVPIYAKMRELSGRNQYMREYHDHNHGSGRNRQAAYSDRVRVNAIEGPGEDSNISGNNSPLRQERVYFKRLERRRRELEESFRHKWMNSQMMNSAYET